MYGVIFDFLRDYVIEKHGGRETWSMLLVETGQSPHKIYFPVKDYPDEEIFALAIKASEALTLPINVVLEDFGTFVGHKLLTFYHMYIKNHDWKTLDIVESAGTYIHDAMARHNPLRKPPVIHAERLSPDELILHYNSPRRLCHVVRGIVAGMADHFGEKFSVKESQCMHNGSDECVFRVRRIAMEMPDNRINNEPVSVRARQA